MSTSKGQTGTAKPRGLKAENVPILRSLVLINAALSVSIILGFTVGIRELSTRLDVVLDSALLMGIASLATLLLSEFLPDDLKAVLVFVRYPNPLPGCRAFSTYANKDARVDAVRLVRSWGELPTAPLEQNRLWYKMLKKQELRKPHILENHRTFLLARDSASVALLLTVAVGLTLPFFSPSPNRPWWLVGFLFVEFLIASSAARSIGISLVKNVLAEESHD